MSGVSSLDETAQQLPCRSYTHARRYPWVIGKVGGWQLPTQLTIAQVAAMASTLTVLIESRALWAHLPKLLNLVTEVALPAAAAWAARHLRVEGRSPMRALAGLVGYLASPRHGCLQGRSHREPVARICAGRVLVTRTCGPRAHR